MLPLIENNLRSNSDWHELKLVLVSCHYNQLDSAREKIASMPSDLKHHPITESINQFLSGNELIDLDDLAMQLTQRDLPDAWTLLERL